jgi:hypothetical protein
VDEGISSNEALLAQAAAHFEVDVAVLKGLLALEAEFPDFSQFGSKAAFSRQVAAVLDTFGRRQGGA